MLINELVGLVIPPTMLIVGTKAGELSSNKRKGSPKEVSIESEIWM